MSKTYVHFGGSWCGPAPYEFDNLMQVQPLGWSVFLDSLLVNKNPNVSENVRYGDILQRPLVMPSSAAGVYCSHVLEHCSFY